MGTSGDERVSEATHATDLDLARRALAGEPMAIELLCQRLACVPAILRDRHARYGAPLRADELEEVQQATIAALWAKLATYEGRASLETWAFRFTVLELLKSLARRDRQRQRAVDAEAELEHVPEREPDEPTLEPERIHAGLEQLGPPANEIIRLRHFEERSFEEISRAYGEPVNTIKARYYRGLERLRQLLEKHLRVR